MLEHRKQPLAPRRVFLKRLSQSIFFALIIILVSLLIGIIGYHNLGKLSWIDSYLEASMILSGMGPTSILHTISGKVFSGLYAIYSGLIMLISLGVIIAPIAHRLFHKFHLEIGDK